MRLADIEVLEDDLVGFADEGCSLEHLGAHLLHLGHVLAVLLACLVHVGLLEEGEAAGVDDAVAVLVVLGEGLLLVLGVHLKYKDVTF